MKQKRKNVIVGVTGSIAAYKACDIINGLRKDGFDVTTIMTGEAEQFITPLTLQSLSANRVYSDMFAKPADCDPVHISLAVKADLILIAPCSANVLGKIAAGICDDLLTCTVMSSKAGVLIAPAMNNNMYENKAVQENLKTLRARSFNLIGPIKGHLVCGTEGIGHLAEVDDIIKEAKRLLRGS